MMNDYPQGIPPEIEIKPGDRVRVRWPIAFDGRIGTVDRVDAFVYLSPGVGDGWYRSSLDGHEPAVPIDVTKIRPGDEVVIRNDDGTVSVTVVLMNDQAIRGLHGSWYHLERVVGHRPKAPAPPADPHAELREALEKAIKERDDARATSARMTERYLEAVKERDDLADRVRSAENALQVSRAEARRVVQVSRAEAGRVVKELLRERDEASKDRDEASKERDAARIRLENIRRAVRNAEGF